MKRFYLLLSALCLPGVLLFAQTSTAPTGTGTAANPYQIATLENLYWLSQNAAQWASGKYYLQTADIDASATSTWFSDGAGGYYGFPCIGGNSSAVGNHVSGTFAANYNGQGFSISNLYIKRGPDFVALFGYAGTAVFRNIKLVNPVVNVQGSSNFQGRAIFMASGTATLDNVHITGGQLNANLTYGYAGSMLGRTGAVTVTNCTSSAAVSSPGNNGFYVGGFIGSPDAASTFTDCAFTGSVSAAGGYVGGFVGQISNNSIHFNRCYSTANVSANYAAGGFSGTVNGGSFTDCFATGNVSANAGTAGGFAAYNLGGTCTFTRCYATGSVTGSSSGGFNAVAGTHTYTSCFWDTETSGKALAFGSGTNANVVGKTTAQMKTGSTFTDAGWDFYGESTNGTNDYWLLDASLNSGYPLLNGNIREWTGGTSTDWSDAANWKGGILPASGSIVIISSTAVHLPAVAADLTLDRFDFNGTAYLYDLGSYNLTCNSVLGYGSNAFIKTSGSGRLKINTANGNLAIFPVGNSSLNTVYIINNTGAADDFSAGVLDEVYVNGSNGTTVNSARIARTWDISKATANAGSGVSFIFNWNPADAVGTMSLPKLYHYGSSWNYQSGTTTATSTSLSYTGYTGSFSPFAVIEGSVILPVSNLVFSAKATNKTVLLNWKTEAEQQTAAYQVQRSADGNTWTDLVSVPAAGNSNSSHQYSTTDPAPLKGYNYYRLQVQDIDGQVQYSKVLPVYLEIPRFNVINTLVTDGQLRVNLEQPAELILSDSKGQQVLRRSLGQGMHTLNLAGVSSGVYYLRDAVTITAIVIK